jgi:signal transduction histidine kinase
MSARPRRGGPGLRTRIVGAVLITTVATLGVAAVALLGPLEHSLRNADRNALNTALKNSAAVSEFSHMHLVADPQSHLAPATPPARVRGALAKLGERLGASVYLFGYPGPAGAAPNPIRPLYPLIDGDLHEDVTLAFQNKHSVLDESIVSMGGLDYARAALYFTTQEPSGVSVQHNAPEPTTQFHWVIAVRKQIDEIPAAVNAVRTAFIDAALAGLGLTLILGIPLSFRIVRRLRRLREGALELAAGGPGATDVRLDRGRDEVGDLGRAFSLMQKRLSQQERARRAFVATASHELRTPLASLDGMLELLSDELREGEPDLEDARTLLERARAQSRRLGRLAADLLDLSRIDAEVTLRSEPVELGELSRAVLAEFELGTSERRIDSSLEAGPDPVWALGDPGSVARILRILLDNAVRATPDGAEIRVELRGGDLVELSVCDTGAGVPPEEQAMIFERFQRGRDTGGRAGFGLGLAIGRELAERMGGSLTLDPEYASGAKFTLRLPAAKARDQDVLVVL